MWSLEAQIELRSLPDFTGNGYQQRLYKPYARQYCRFTEHRPVAVWVMQAYVMSALLCGVSSQDPPRALLQDILFYVNILRRRGSSRNEVVFQSPVLSSISVLTMSWRYCKVNAGALLWLRKLVQPASCSAHCDWVCESIIAMTRDLTRS